MLIWILCGAGCTTHRTSEFVELVAPLIEMGCYDLNKGDFLGCTALSLAALGGHEEVVKILLQREEVNPNGGINLAQHRSCMPLMREL